METSIFLAKLLGPYCLIIAIGIFFNFKTYQKVIGDFYKNLALMYLGGVMALFFGLLILLFHNVWAASWVVIITIFGWLGIIKGVWLIISPDRAIKVTKAYQKKTTLFKVHLVIVFIVGVSLTYFGYF